MVDRICVEFYELKFSTIPVARKSEISVPYEYVAIKPVFESLRDNLGETYKTNSEKVNLKINDKVWRSNGRYSTCIQHLEVYDDHIRLAISCFDKEAPDRTLHDIFDGQEEVQSRGESQAEKDICHCIIKFTDHQKIAILAFQKVNKFPPTVIAQAINALLTRLKTLERKLKKTDGIFCAENTDGIRDDKGDLEKVWFKLKPSIQPLIGDELIKAVTEGRLNSVKVSSWTHHGFDDPNNDFSTQKEELVFAVKSLPVNNDENSVRGYIKRLLSNAKSNRRVKFNSKTALLLTHEQTGNTQICNISENDSVTDFSERFIRRKFFDPSDKQQRSIGNTTHNDLFFQTIFNIMDD